MPLPEDPLDNSPDDPLDGPDENDPILVPVLLDSTDVSDPVNGVDLTGTVQENPPASLLAITDDAMNDVSVMANTKQTLTLQVGLLTTIKHGKDDYEVKLVPVPDVTNVWKYEDHSGMHDFPVDGVPAVADGSGHFSFKVTKVFFKNTSGVNYSGQNFVFTLGNKKITKGPNLATKAVHIK